MKKNILILLLVSIACILTQSQAAEVLLLDSVIVQNEVDKQAEKITFDYNSNGLMEVQTHYQRENKQVAWLPNWKSEKSYDDQYNETTAISFYFDKGKNEWNEISKSETQYASGIQTIAYLRESENWIPVLKSENKNNSLIILSSWQNNQWILSDKYETTFSDYETTSANSVWNETTETWSQNIHSESTFNENGKLMVSVLYHDYKNQRAIHIQYDGENRLSSEERYKWNDETRDWTENLKTDYHYDVQNRLIETVESSWRPNLDCWVELQKTEYQYADNETLPTTAIHYSWSNIWISIANFSYFYSTYLMDVTVGKPVQMQTQIRIYPNPVNDWFRVSGLTDNAILNVLNINGKRLIYQNIQEDEAVSAQSLPEGVYVVTVQIGENIVSQKIVKK